MEILFAFLFVPVLIGLFLGYQYLKEKIKKNISNDTYQTLRKIRIVLLGIGVICCGIIIDVVHIFKVGFSRATPVDFTVMLSVISCVAIMLFFVFRNDKKI